MIPEQDAQIGSREHICGYANHPATDFKDRYSGLLVQQLVLDRFHPNSSRRGNFKAPE
jgi:hypothetical protein